MLGMPAGGGVRMSVFAVARGRYDPQVVRRVSGGARYCLRRAPLADVACAIAGLLVSYTINLGLSPGYVLVARPSATVPDLVTRFAIRTRLAPPDEAATYADRTRRRLVIKPGPTGSGRSAGNHICPGRNRHAAW